MLLSWGFFFTDIGAEKLGVSFGMGKKLRYISIHDICNVISPIKAYAVPAFHALTGCNNTSFFSGTGKKYAYGKWSTRPDLTTTLCYLMERPLTITLEDIKVIDSFVVTLYSVTCTFTEVTFEYLPPTKAALRAHKESILSSWIRVRPISCD